MRRAMREKDYESMKEQVDLMSGAWEDRKKIQEMPLEPILSNKLVERSWLSKVGQKTAEGQHVINDKYYKSGVSKYRGCISMCAVGVCV